MYLLAMHGLSGRTLDPRLLLVFLIYVVCGWAGIEYASIGNGSLTMIWLPSGISLAACIIYGQRIWPAIWLGSFAANTPYLIASSISASLFHSVLIGAVAASINTCFQALMAYSLYRRHIDNKRFYSGSNIVRFVTRVIPLPSIINITLLMLLYTISGYWELRHPDPLIALAQVGIFSALSDLHGYFVIVPMVVCLQAAGRRSLKDYLAERQVFVALACFVALILASFFLSSLVVYLFIPLGVFVALKIGVRATMVLLFATSMVFSFTTAQGIGPFAYADVGHAYAALLLFIFSLGLPTLLLAAETRALKEAYSDMEDRVQERTRKLDEANRQLETASRTDMVTGVANRRYLEERLDIEWRRAQRNASPLSLLLIDIDSFKEYNDHFGHLAGDAVLARVAAALQNELNRPSDFIARYGGEEFVILLPDTREPGIIAERCRSAVEGLAITHGHGSEWAVVTVSAGYAWMVPEPGTRAKKLVEMADRALYQAKRSGRNRVASHDDLIDSSGH